MRIFILGAGAAGSLLAQLLTRQGHRVRCGDRDPERARRFLGKKSPIPVVPVNARNLRAIVRAARGCHLLINSSPAVFNEIILRAALRLGCHYMDMAAHLGRNPFKAEQLRYHERFRAKNRLALIDAGVAPGLTNLLVRRSAAMLDAIDSVHVRLYEGTEAEDPISSWSAEVSWDEATSRPSVYREGRFRVARRFSEPEWFRFPPPIGRVRMVLAAQDEVATLPRAIPMREMDVKIGGNEIDRLRRWYRQGKLTPSRGLAKKHFPQTPTPRLVARMIRSGKLQNARFAAAVLVRGVRRERPMLVRWDAEFPSLYQMRVRGMWTTPIAYATANVAALFVRHFPRKLAGVFPPEALPYATCLGVLEDVRSRDIHIVAKVKRLAAREDEDEEI